MVAKYMSYVMHLRREPQPPNVDVVSSLSCIAIEVTDDSTITFRIEWAIIYSTRPVFSQISPPLHHMPLEDL